MRASCHPHCEPESQGELAAVQSSFQRIACAFIDSTQRRTPQPNWQLALVWKQQSGSEQEAAAVGGETVTLTLSFQPEPSTSSSLPHTRISLLARTSFAFFHHLSFLVQVIFLVIYRFFPLAVWHYDRGFNLLSIIDDLLFGLLSPTRGRNDYLRTHPAGLSPLACSSDTVQLSIHGIAELQRQR